MDPMFTTGRLPSTGSDVDHMPETPQRGTHHRRSHSDTSFRFGPSILDDLLFFDASDFNFDFASPTTLTAAPVGVSAPRYNPMAGESPVTSMSYMSSDESTGQPMSNPGQTQPPLGHQRSLSVDSDFFEGLSLNDGFPGKISGAKRTAIHRHSSSMDGTTSLTASLEAESSIGLVVDSAKTALGSDKLAELALVDPKRARRILANRQSAARSKERKIRYTSELERKVQTIQNEATTLSAQVTMLQRDTTGLTAENKELKLRLEAMEQQAKLKDALNDALREEVQHLKMVAGRVAAVNGNLLNGGLPPQFPSFQAGSLQLGNPQNQQAIQQADGLSPLWSSGNQGFNWQPQPSNLDSKQRTN